MDFNPSALIRKKRDGESLSREELEQFVGSYARGEIPDYQMSAMLMAVFYNGMTDAETIALTDVMLHSGTVVDLSSIPGPKVDKHSTGGVGDKVSLIVAPMVAACGVAVPMISGRGLGHTGGTLDKLEAIPGFRTDLSIGEYKRVIASEGLVLIGQTAEIVPADKKMYALRDVTATVESLPLIAGSIMSKKLAEGIDALVLDVKTGNGAFMRTHEESIRLAHMLVSIGVGLGKETVGFITAMDQPLGHNVGNWLEVCEAMECLRGKAVSDLMEVSLVLGGAMLWLGGKARDVADGIAQCRSAIWSGRAYEKFLACARAQGGDVSYLENPARYPAPRNRADIKSPRAGIVSSFDTMTIGLLGIELGAGRKKVDDPIDPKAGLIFHKKLGDRVETDELLVTAFCDDRGALDRIVPDLVRAIGIGGEQSSPAPRVLSFVDRHGVHEWTTPEGY